MKTIITSIVSLLFFGQIIAQDISRNLDDFNSIQIKNALDVTLTHGEENKVVITGINTADAEKIKTEVVNGELLISSQGKIKGKDALVVVLTYTQLNNIHQSGASKIAMTNAYKTEQFSVTGSGAIEADLNLEVTKLTVDFSGASDIKIVGSATNFDLTLSGASDMKAQNFIAGNVKINVSGASDVKVNATKSITGKASGASNVNIKGNPAIRTINGSTATSTSYYNRENVSINLGGGKIDIKDENVKVNMGKRGVDVRNDTTTVNWGHTNVIMIGDSVHVTKTPKKRKRHWAGVDLGINGFFDGNGSLDLSNPPSLQQTNPQKVTQFMELDYRKSWTFAINFMEFYIPIKQHNFGFVTGMGTEWNNYELKHNVRLNPEGGENVFPTADAYNQNYTWGEIDTVLDYTKNRFKTWFINVPLLFEVSTGDNSRKAFHMAAGAIVGYNLQTKIKYKYFLDGDHKKEKDKDDFNTNPFRVSLTTRVGYGWFNVFATYSLTPLFENGRGPQLQPFTIGVSLIGF